MQTCSEVLRKAREWVELRVGAAGGAVFLHTSRLLAACGFKQRRTRNHSPPRSNSRVNTADTWRHHVFALILVHFPHILSIYTRHTVGRGGGNAEACAS